MQASDRAQRSTAPSQSGTSTLPYAAAGSQGRPPPQVAAKPPVLPSRRGRDRPREMPGEFRHLAAASPSLQGTPRMLFGTISYCESTTSVCVPVQNWRWCSGTAAVSRRGGRGGRAVPAAARGQAREHGRGAKNYEVPAVGQAQPVTSAEWPGQLPPAAAIQDAAPAQVGSASASLMPLSTLHRPLACEACHRQYTQHSMGILNGHVSLVQDLSAVFTGCRLVWRSIDNVHSMALSC